MKHILLFIIHGSLFIILSGCGELLPDGMPRLEPCKIKIVTEKNEPVAGAAVNAMPVQQDNIWAGIGLTNNEGIAVMKTNGKYAGLPTGKFKIVVSKYKVESRGEDKEPLETLLLDKVFASEKTTPLEFEVKTGNNETVLTVR